jgi:hypothetical protein
MFLKVKLESDGGGSTLADGVQPPPAIGPCSHAISIFIVMSSRVSAIVAMPTLSVTEYGIYDLESADGEKFGNASHPNRWRDGDDNFN